IADGFDDSEVAEATYTIEPDDPGELAFSVPFNVSDGTANIDLTVGVDPNGSVDFVSGLDQLAPPAPPDGAFDARIKVGGISYFIKYLDNTIAEKTFNFEYSAGNTGTTPITFTWDNSALAGLGTFTVKDTFGGAVFSEDLTTYGGTFVPSQASPLLANGFVLTILPSGTQPPDPVAATPTFDPAGGTYTGSVDVSISSATAEATVYYTTDGSTPDASATEYTGSITLTETTTLKAIAIADGFDDSEVAEATYTIETVQPPSDLAFGIPFTVGDGVASIDLTVGVDPNGSSTDFVSGLDQLAPPAPPDGAFDARVKVNGTSYFAKYQDNALTQKTFNFEYVAGS
ncbi:MAG: chitobiase/beta-hexosaminidase C-terminal domain-containing protein, partial [Aquiluna sp.]